MERRKSYFVSDLHLFSRRSKAALHTGELIATARTAEHFVLGGDIFDFCWTTLPTIAETVKAAHVWLDRLAAGAPACRFHFILGNHDHHDEFITVLDQLQRDRANFAWHPYFLRHGTSLFLHGDVADRYSTPETLAAARGKWSKHPRRGEVRNWLYDVAIAARLHLVVAKVAFPEQRTAVRLLHYIEQIGHGPGSGVTDVYFGHTHLPLDGYEYRGLRFHNGGAPMHGIAFRIVEAVMNGEG